jgi:hypothetical protein
MADASTYAVDRDSGLEARDVLWAFFDFQYDGVSRSKQPDSNAWRSSA